MVQARGSVERPETDYRFRVLYAIGMVLIVGGHCGYGGLPMMATWFPPYSFHLGLFAFCSGYFCKDGAGRALGKYAAKKFWSLIVPLYLWNVVYAGIVTLLSYGGFTIGAGVTLSKLVIEPITTGHQFMYNLGGWFVVPLFMIQVFHAAVRRVATGKPSACKECILFGVYLCMGMAGVYLASRGYHAGWWLVLVRALYLLPFYGMGIFYRNVLEKYDTASHTKYFAALFMLQLYIILIFKGVPAYTPSWCDDFTDGPVLPFVVGYIGIAFWLRVARILAPVIGKSRPVNLIADSTYAIMIHHYMGFMIVKMVFALFHNYFALFGNFDVLRYKTDLSYFYLPGGMGQFAVIYLAAGLIFPAILQLALKRAERMVKTRKPELPLRKRGESDR